MPTSFRSALRSPVLALAFLSRTAAGQVSGDVYLDANANGRRDAGERGLPRVAVSNQHDVVATDSSGRFSLPGAGTGVVFVSVPEGYRAQLNMALDHVFFEPSGWYTEESDRLLDFFAGEGMDLYGSSYPLDGSRCLQCGRSGALVAMNGTSAMAAAHPERTAFIEAVWEMVPPEGEFRYYDGLLHLLSLLVLSGQLRVY